MLKNLLVELGVVVVIAIIFYVWWNREESLDAPGQLAQQALSASTASAQEEAALQLATLAVRLEKSQSRNPARESLVRVMKEGKTPAVRGAAMVGLAQIWDYDSMPALLDALGDGDATIRRSANASVQQLLSVVVPFNADDPLEARKPTVDYLKQQWALMNKPDKDGKTRVQLFTADLENRDK